MDSTFIEVVSSWKDEAARYINDAMSGNWEEMKENGGDLLESCQHFDT